MFFYSQNENIVMDLYLSNEACQKRELNILNKIGMEKYIELLVDEKIEGLKKVEEKYKNRFPDGPLHDPDSLRQEYINELKEEWKDFNPRISL